MSRILLSKEEANNFILLLSFTTFVSVFKFPSKSIQFSSYKQNQVNLSPYFSFKFEIHFSFASL